MDSNLDFSEMIVTGVKSAVRLHNVPMNSYVRRKNRECWGLALKQTGKTVYVTEKGRVYSDSLHPVLLPMGSDYSWACMEAGTCLMIEFECPFTADVPYSFEVSSNSILLRNFIHIEKRKIGKTDNSTIKNIYDLYSSLLFLEESCKGNYVPSRKHLIVQPAVDYMLHSYADPNITNDALAAMCGISTVYFRKVFTGVYHVSPMQRLRSIRMEQAGALLRSDYCSIRQVAENVGYTNLYNFSKMFKQYYGVPPSRFHSLP